MYVLTRGHAVLHLVHHQLAGVARLWRAPLDGGQRRAHLRLVPWLRRRARVRGLGAARGGGGRGEGGAAARAEERSSGHVARVEEATRRE